MFFPPLLSSRFAQREVEAISAHQRMIAFFEREHAVIGQSGWPTPHDDIPVGERDVLLLVWPFRSSKHQDGWQAQRDRDNRLTQIPFVFVLMQGKLCSWLIPIDQTFRF